MKLLACVLLMGMVGWGQDCLFRTPEGGYVVNCFADLPLSDRHLRDLMPLVEPLAPWFCDYETNHGHPCQGTPPSCDHNSVFSCASQANGDYGPGRSGLVGEMAPIREDHPCYGHLLPDGTCHVDTPKFGHLQPYAAGTSGFGGTVTIAAEPMDVPAIHARGSKTIYHFKGGVLVDGAFSECHGELKWALSDKDELQCIELPRWSCADKSRILLTDEAGEKHCIKF